jgi:hypothetical protein
MNNYSYRHQLWPRARRLRQESNLFLYDSLVLPYAARKPRTWATDWVASPSMPTVALTCTDVGSRVLGGTTIATKGKAGLWTKMDFI